MFIDKRNESKRGKFTDYDENYYDTGNYINKIPFILNLSQLTLCKIIVHFILNNRVSKLYNYFSDSVDKPDSNPDDPKKENRSSSFQSDLSGHDDEINTLLEDPFIKNILDEKNNSLFDIPTDGDNFDNLTINCDVQQGNDKSLIQLDNLGRYKLNLKFKFL